MGPLPIIRTERILLSLGISGDKGMDKLGAKIKTDLKFSADSAELLAHPASAPASAFVAPLPGHYRKVAVLRNARLISLHRAANGVRQRILLCFAKIAVCEM